MTAIDEELFNVGIPRSYLAGMQTTPTVASTSVSIAEGVCMGNDQSTAIRLTSALVKVLSSSWAVGTGNGGLYAATSIQGNQSYHLFTILRTDTDVVDAYFDTSVTAANIPSPYTIYRRVASMKTSTSTNMVDYIQDGDFFQPVTPRLDPTSATPGTNAVTHTLVAVPSGINARVLLNITVPTGAFAYVSDLATTDMAPSRTITPLVTHGGEPGTAQIETQITVRTNTSAQIRTRLSANVAMLMAVTGWFDTRGRND